MIILPSKRIIICTPPHTASRHLHHAVCETGTGVPGAIWMMSPCPDGTTIDHHGVRMIADWEHWTQAIVVRNPFDRLIGLWWHLVDWCRFNGHGCNGFDEFVEWVADDDHSRLSWMYRFTITRWLGELQPNRVLRYETLATDIVKLVDQTIDMKPPNARPRRSIEDHYNNPRTRELAVRWALPDCERFGYSASP